jgi:predicted ArsR family transcriptional regulator
MLSKLIELLLAGGTHRVSDIAHSLGTTPQLVEAMLEDLTRMGYLRQLGTQCEGQCKMCPVAGMCTAEANGRVWTLTEKGSGERV